jgi:cobalamin biosynthesis protein CobD/CbiB
MTGALNIQLEKKGEYLLDGGNKVCEFQLIDRALKIVITSIIVIILFSIILLEVLN